MIRKTGVQIAVIFILTFTAVWAHTGEVSSSDGAAISVSQFLLGSLTVAFAVWSLAVRGVKNELKELRLEFTKLVQDVNNSVKEDVHILVKENHDSRLEISQLAARVIRNETEIMHIMKSLKPNS